MPTKVVDDHDPSVVYSSGWRQGGSATEQNGTTMYTNIEGATATLTFTGIGVSVSGTVAGNSTLYRTPPRSSYKLDDSQPVYFQPSGIAPQQRYPFYQSEQLPNGQHTLVVTNMINGSIILVLDYMTITMEDKAASTTTTTTQHIAGPVGGAIAAVLLVFGVIGAFYFWRRRKRRLQDNQNSSLVPTVWMHSSHPTYGLPATPLGPNKLMPSSSSSPSTTPLPPSKGMPSIQVSLPSSTNHASSSNESDHPQAAPPSYTVAVCMVTSTG